MSNTYKAEVWNDTTVPGTGTTERYYQTGVGFGAYADRTEYADRYAAAGDCLRAQDATPNLNANNSIYIREYVSPDGGTTWYANGVYVPGLTPGTNPTTGSTRWP